MARSSVVCSVRGTSSISPKPAERQSLFPWWQQWQRDDFGPEVPQFSNSTSLRPREQLLPGCSRMGLSGSVWTITRWMMFHNLTPTRNPRLTSPWTGLGMVHIFTTLDLNKGYWQIPLSPGSKDKAAFPTCMVCSNSLGFCLGCSVHWPPYSASWTMCCAHMLRMRLSTWMVWISTVTAGPNICSMWPRFMSHPSGFTAWRIPYRMAPWSKSGSRGEHGQGAAAEERERERWGRLRRAAPGEWLTELAPG